mmetsp:Transcript_4476/g.8302  ORF Transcript_4476/g.8302 Transcript_4476/m.8302 type:complete len:81 (+) Transcript_4476:830-1072(+)
MVRMRVFHNRGRSRGGTLSTNGGGGFLFNTTGDIDFVCVCRKQYVDETNRSVISIEEFLGFVVTKMLLPKNSLNRSIVTK